MNMPAAQHSVTIRRSVEDVFRFVADGENGPKWRSGILDIARVSGDGGTGTVYRQGVRGPMGRRIAADYRLSSVVPNQVLEFETIAGPVRPHGRYDFESIDDGTRLTFALDAEMGGLRRLFMGSMVQKTMIAEVGSLDTLKRVLES
jgi:uncharacterized protein YndB with AHSA1/START domain